MNTSVLETNQTLAQRYRAELWNGRIETAEEITAPDCVLHVNDSFTPAVDPGPAALRQLVTMYRAAFPDASFTVEDVIADATKVVVRWHGQATQQGALGAIAATGKSVSVTGMDLLHINNGQVTAVWTNWDALGLLKQLGLAS